MGNTEKYMFIYRWVSNLKEIYTLFTKSITNASSIQAEGIHTSTSMFWVGKGCESYAYSIILCSKIKDTSDYWTLQVEAN